MSDRRTDIIDVHDLPEAIAEAIAQHVRALRQGLKKNGKSAGPLGVWPLGSNSPLSREEIYGDRLDAKLNDDRA